MPSVYAGWHRFGLESKRKPETSEWDQISIKFAVRVCKNVRHMRWRQLEFLEARIHPWTLNFVDEIQIEIPPNAVNKKRSCCKPFSRSALNPITTSDLNESQPQRSPKARQPRKVSISRALWTFCSHIQFCDVENNTWDSRVYLWKPKRKIKGKVFVLFMLKNRGKFAATMNSESLCINLAAFCFHAK